MRSLLVILSRLVGIALLMALTNASAAITHVAERDFPDETSTRVTVSSLASKLRVGDVIFIRVPARPFREVATATGSWTNHVGIVVDMTGREPLIAESTFPLSRIGTFSRFASRSEGGRLAVRRLDDEPNSEQEQNILEAARRRAGIHYDTGFNLHSRGQFCSRFVREVLMEATGHEVGEIETFAQLLSRRPGADLRFWHVWYLGHIPWERQTVSPASILQSAALRPVFDGIVLADK